MTNREEVHALEERVYFAILNVRNSSEGEPQTVATKRLAELSSRYHQHTGKCFDVTDYQRRKGISTEQ